MRCRECNDKRVVPFERDGQSFMLPCPECRLKEARRERERLYRRFPGTLDDPARIIDRATKRP